ncbi:MAG: hypothetical protein V1904_14295 [Bacteroidota bacterium]
MSGVGGISSQNSDYSKHNAVFRDLITLDWPVFYDGNSALIYYVAYYLPAAIVGKLFGWSTANIAIIIWTISGVCLFVLWVSVNAKTNVIISVFVIIIFSGMDFIGNVLYGHFPGGTEHMEWWNRIIIMQYSSNTTLLYWVPQHALGGWIVSSVLIYLFKRKRLERSIFLFISLSLLWSPFITIGLSVFIIALLIGRSWKIKSYISVHNLIGVFLSVIIVSYYISSNRYGLGLHDFSWRLINYNDNWHRLLIMYLLEFGLLAFVIYKNFNSSDKIMLIAAVLFLLLIPFYIIGIYNDLGMRSTIPALTIVMCFSAQALRCRKPIWIIIILLIGSLTAVPEILRPVRAGWNYTFCDGWYSIWATGNNLRNQYIGQTDSFFFRHLSSQNKSSPKNTLQLEDLTWQKGSLSDNKEIEISLENKTVRSKVAVDAAIYSNLNIIPGHYIVKIGVSGEIISGTGHFSLSGKNKLISLPVGVYGIENSFYCHAEINKDDIIAFGLGGWGIGSGFIKLENLAFYKYD